MCSSIELSSTPSPAARKAGRGDSGGRRRERGWVGAAVAPSSRRCLSGSPSRKVTKSPPSKRPASQSCTDRVSSEPESRCSGASSAPGEGLQRLAACSQARPRRCVRESEAARLPRSTSAARRSAPAALWPGRRARPLASRAPPGVARRGRWGVMPASGAALARCRLGKEVLAPVCKQAVTVQEERHVFGGVDDVKASAAGTQGWPVRHRGQKDAATERGSSRTRPALGTQAAESSRQL